MAAPGAAIKLRRLRQYFGIRAPKVSVRTHIPWYWRGLAIVCMLSVSIALAEWVYDAGRNIAGFDSNTSAQVITELRGRIAELEAEQSVIRGALTSAESNFKIEQAAQQQLAQQVRLLEAENAVLKQDLAFFDGLLPDNLAGEPGIRIKRFRVEQDVGGGQYRYRLLIVHNPSKQKEFKGKLVFVLKVQQAGKDVMIDFPSEGDSASERLKLEVKHFQRIEGILPIPEGSILKSVEARILSDGQVQARQTITP